MSIALNPWEFVAEAFARRPRWSSKRSGSHRVTESAGEAERRSLSKGAILTVERPLNCEVECLSGALWVTHDGDPKDNVLESGQTYRADRAARLLIQALEAAELRVRTEAGR